LLEVTDDFKVPGVTNNYMTGTLLYVTNEAAWNWPRICFVCTTRIKHIQCTDTFTSFTNDTTFSLSQQFNKLFFRITNQFIIVSNIIFSLSSKLPAIHHTKTSNQEQMNLSEYQHAKHVKRP